VGEQAGDALGGERRGDVGAQLVGQRRRLGRAGRAMGDVDDLLVRAVGQE
jgi:hypothetical protein